jgi:hypothetical protein
MNINHKGTAENNAKIKWLGLVKIYENSPKHGNGSRKLEVTCSSTTTVLPATNLWTVTV